jgi:hypothetical protein
VTAGDWLAVGLLLAGALAAFVIDRARYGRHS